MRPNLTTATTVGRTASGIPKATCSSIRKHFPLAASPSEITSTAKVGGRYLTSVQLAGLKFGIYSSDGTKTCQVLKWAHYMSRSQAHINCERMPLTCSGTPCHASPREGRCRPICCLGCSFLSPRCHPLSPLLSRLTLGVDYLKLDNCYDEGIPPRQRYPISSCFRATSLDAFISLRQCAMHSTPRAVPSSSPCARLDSCSCDLL
jgi:hypothetical protein